MNHLRRIAGIYCFLHILSGKRYIGSSKNLLKRYREHLRMAARGSRNCFHSALRDFGAEAFEFTVLELCPKEKLLEREKVWIMKYKSASLNGFNTRSNPIATYDHKPSEVTLQRMSEAHKGKKYGPLSEEHKRQISAYHKGRKRSPETCERIRQAQLKRDAVSDAAKKAMSDAQKARNAREAAAGNRKVLTPEQRAQISATLKAKGIKPPSRAGTVTSEEQKAKQRAAMLGQKMPASQREKMKILAANRSPEHLAKIAAGNRGKVISEEQREKIRQTLAATRMKKAAALQESNDLNQLQKVVKTYEVTSGNPDG